MMFGRSLRRSLFRRRTQDTNGLSTELLRWSRDDSWTVRDATRPDAYPVPGVGP